MSDNLCRITYASRAAFRPNYQGGLETQVARILLQSRKNNSKVAIGGVLHYGEGYFFQCLEGEESIVVETLKRISKDPRHTDVKVLSKEKVSERLFTDWSMKYLALEKNLMSVLKRHDLERFNPYKFTFKLIDDLLEVCALGIEPKEYASSSDSKPSFMNRMMKKLGLTKN
ncbi:MAG: BLUF domain-containing protein [Kangiellaceae bacterium]|nr:BLUF domain-containing protein [Kangiellaceae bacterium]